MVETIVKIIETFRVPFTKAIMEENVCNVDLLTFISRIQEAPKARITENISIYMPVQVEIERICNN